MITPKGLDRFEQRIQEIPRRAKGVSMEMTMEELPPYVRGSRVISDSAKRRACCDRLNPLGPVATQGGFVVAVKNTALRIPH